MKSAAILITLLLLLGTATASAQMVHGDSPDFTLDTTGRLPGVGGIGQADSPDFVLDTRNLAAVLSSMAYVNGHFQLTITGSPGALYTLDTSTNLIDWIYLGEGLSPFIFVHTNASTEPHRFYRAGIE